MVQVLSDWRSRVCDLRKAGYTIYDVQKRTMLERRRTAERALLNTYYAHSSEKMQGLMEKSALVIIDFNKAIESGYVKLCDDIRNQYLTEYPDNGE
jgi:hypothetical protein